MVVDNMKVILYMAMSANGCIATQDNETPWSKAEWGSFSGVVKQTGNMVIGRKTYEIMERKKEFSNLGNPLVIVLSKTKSKHKLGNEENNVVFVRSPQEALNVLQEKEYTTAMVAGGSEINTSFMRENVVDELFLDIEPLIFGKGIPLFATDHFEKKLDLVNVTNLSENTIQLHYKVKHKK